MKSLSILIVDDTIIGQALGECFAHFVLPTLDRHRINIQIISNKNGKEIANSSDKILAFISANQNNPSLIFINLMLKIQEQYGDHTMPGLYIAEEISLSNPKQKANILLYSFDRESSLRRYDRFNYFISLPGHIYFSLPINIEGHLRSWMELAEALSISSDQEEGVRGLFSSSARRVSRQYLKDFEHSIIDKVLSKMLADLRGGQGPKSYFMLKSKIDTLFSVEVSELCGIDMQIAFSAERIKIRECLKTMGQAASSDILVTDTEKLKTILSSVVERAMKLSGRWESTFNYSVELEGLYGCANKLKELLDTVWNARLCELADNGYANTWRMLKPKIFTYYEWRARIESYLWKLSIWEKGERLRRKILDLLKEVLDPLMERIAEEDYTGACAIFDRKRLETIGIETRTPLSNFFVNEIGGNHD